MAKKTEYVHGQFSWVDLQTSDVEGAKKFYGALLGWEFNDVPTDQGVDYTLCMSHGEVAAGISPLSPNAAKNGAPPSWSNYINVVDAEATEASAKEQGATVLMSTMKVMDQGFFAFLQDPTGGSFGIWQAGTHHGAGWINEPGGFCWNELYTRDVTKARTFYEKLFGWTFESSEGSMGEYWSIKNHGSPNGGMMGIQKEWGEMPSHWAAYLTVEDCAKSTSAVEAAGGTIFMPPKAIPEVGTIAGVQDPQGARFMIIEMNLTDAKA